jgi:hypothetical protein
MNGRNDAILPMTQTSAAAADLLAGAAAGLAAAFVMNLFQAALSRALSKDDETDTAASKAADAVTEEVSGAPVKRRYKKSADTSLHYLTGAIAGGMYGLLGGRMPALFAGRGLVYGTALWAIADEALVPALGLAPPPSQVGAKEHGFALASHLIFGLALDLCRRQINRVISAGPV